MWANSKSTGLPLRQDLPEPAELPWTIAYCIRKREQVLSYGELPKEKRPPETMIWWGSPEDIENWFDRVMGRKSKEQEVVMLDITEDDIG